MPQMATYSDNTCERTVERGQSDARSSSDNGKAVARG
jgi:hypothetical protein